MMAMVSHLFDTVGLSGLAALWALKALLGVAVLRALRPWWGRLRHGRGHGT